LESLESAPEHAKKIFYLFIYYLCIIYDIGHPKHVYGP